MAYDANDPKDVELVEGIVAERLEAETTTLKTLVTKLRGEIKELKKTGNDPAAIEKLEGELETTREALNKAQNDLKSVTKVRDKAVKDLESEQGFSRKTLVENALTESLTKANVAPHLLSGAKALLQGKVTIKVDGENRSCVIGDKELGAFVTEWSASDEGKHYVKAPASGGANATGSGTQPVSGGKTITRTEFDGMDQAARGKFFAEKGRVAEE